MTDLNTPFKGISYQFPADCYLKQPQEPVTPRPSFKGIFSGVALGVASVVSALQHIRPHF
ncbi:MAG: hypothetical protein V4621_06615 [Pseudomonadota bacterium]